MVASCLHAFDFLTEFSKPGGWVRIGGIAAGNYGSGAFPKPGETISKPTG
jgi:hypothetical protein